MTVSSTETFCYNHPDRETGLRCNRCDRLICTSCAVRVATGYRCPQCIREQKKVFDTAQIQDYVLGFIVAFVLSYIGSLITQAVSFFFFLVFLVAPAVGALIAKVVRKVVGRRRSKTLFQVITVAVVLGGVPLILDDILYILIGGGLQGLIGLLFPAIYIILAASSTYVRLSGIQLNR